MESKQINITIKDTLLKRIDNWYKLNANKKVNQMRFDIDSKVDLFCYKVNTAIERVLKTDKYCDDKLTEKELESLKKLIK